MADEIGASSSTSSPSMVLRTKPKCCLCQCFLHGTTGTRFNHVNLEKLSKWWKANYGVEFQKVVDLERSWFCQNCILDARHSHEENKGAADPDVEWWPKNASQDLLFRNYKDGLDFDEDQQKEAVIRNKKVAEFHSKLPTKLEVGGSPSKSNQYCSKLALSELELPIHTRAKHPEKFGEESPLKCPNCSKMYQSKKCLANHLQKAHSEKIANNNCTIKFCLKVCQSEDELQKHVEQDHQIPCPECSSKYVWVGQRDKHFKLHHKNLLLSCAENKCARTFVTQNDSRKHFKNFHLLPKCAYCKASFEKFHQRRTHVKRFHLEKGSVMCSYGFCAEFFLTEAELDHHFVDEHSKEGLQKCEHCGLRFSAARYLRKHEKLHMPHHRGQEDVLVLPAKKRTAVRQQKQNEQPNSAKIFAPVDASSFWRVCPHCGWSILPAAFDRHTAPMTCLSCKQTYSCRRTLDDHQCPNQAEESVPCRLEAIKVRIY